MSRPLLTLLLIAVAANADAQDLRTADSPIKLSSITLLNEAQLAQAWQLTPGEWERYRQLMQGPLGIYSPNLDPLSALGIEARSVEERQRYARLQVDAEAARVEKLLTYQRAYDEAWAQAFPGQLRVDLPSTHLPSTERLAVFVRADCSQCAQKIQQLQAANSGFDLYLVDSQQDDSRLRQWALRTGVDPNKVRDQHITLNHDNGRWQSLGISGDLPAVVRRMDGRWVRQ